MAYEKIGFTKGQALKADDLNHIEEGLTINQTTSIGLTFPSDGVCKLENLDNKTKEEVLTLLNQPNVVLYDYDSYGFLHRVHESLRWSGVLLSLAGNPIFVTVNFNKLIFENSSSSWQGEVETFFSLQNPMIDIDSSISDQDYYALLTQPHNCILHSEKIGIVFRAINSKTDGNQLLLSGYGSMFTESGIPVGFKIFGGIDEERNFNQFSISIDPMYLTIETITESIEAVQEHISSGFPVYTTIGPGIIQGFVGAVPIQQDAAGNLFVKIESITGNTYFSTILRFVNGAMQTYMLQQKQLSTF